MRLCRQRQCWHVTVLLVLKLIQSMSGMLSLVGRVASRGVKCFVV